MNHKLIVKQRVIQRLQGQTSEPQGDCFKSPDWLEKSCEVAPISLLRDGIEQLAAVVDLDVK